MKVQRQSPLTDKKNIKLYCDIFIFALLHLSEALLININHLIITILMSYFK